MTRWLTDELKSPAARALRAPRRFRPPREAIVTIQSRNFKGFRSGKTSFNVHSNLLTGTSPCRMVRLHQEMPHRRRLNQRVLVRCWRRQNEHAFILFDRSAIMPAAAYKKGSAPWLATPTLHELALTPACAGVECVSLATFDYGQRTCFVRFGQFGLVSATVCWPGS